MKYVVILLLLTTCGYQRSRGPQGEPGTSGKPCSVSEDGIISCPDGTSYTMPVVRDGTDGADGADGVDGEMGPAGEIGPTGETGPSGQDGIAGADGTDGASCSVDSNGLVSCTDGSSYQLPNREVSVIDPCGDGSGVDEVLLRIDEVVLRVNERSIGGGNKKYYLSQAAAGTYVTSDAQACSYTVAVDGSVAW
jgi:hypothetical protein